MDRPLIVGIINSTPDSFYDGGVHADPIAYGRQLVEDGADWLDIGGESTRPGATFVNVEEECRRVLPVIEALCGLVPISIDTSKPEVARRAAQAGATILNDVTGLSDPEMISVSSEFDTTVVMHSRGTPQDMMGLTDYCNLIEEITQVLVSRAQACGSRRVFIDPGIGFAKTADQSIAVLRNISVFVSTGFPVLIGASRKSFIGHVAQIEDPKMRLPGSLAGVASAYHGGASAVRVHDVAATKQFLTILSAIERVQQ